MKHAYYAIYDRAAKCYVHVSESKTNETFSRMCDALAKDKTTFIGVAPEDYKGYHVADFDDETGTFISCEPEKIWEGKPNE
nr:MAG TPA: DNA binding protein [Microviridae sp.]